MSIQKKPLTAFKLAMMAVIAIDSLKNLPANAQYGESLLIYYIIAIIAFFIPSAVVAAELATAWPATGGIYIWIKEAFGKRTAFLVACILSGSMIVWYPTILSFIAVTLAYLINSHLAQNKIYILAIILLTYWLATLLNCMGLKISSLISTLSAIMGAILPMLMIIFLGAFWLCSGHSSQIHFSLHNFPLQTPNLHNLQLFIILLFSLAGIDMIAIHAGDTQHPQRDYVKALIFTVLIIIITVTPASLAISIVIPLKQIDITTGVIEGFIIFLNALHVSFLIPFIIMSVILGSFGVFFTWLLATARCLLVAAQDGCLPKLLQKTNAREMPVNLMLIQGIIFTILCTAFILMPSVSSAFWLLTAASSQLGLIYYLFLFAAALRLRYTQPHVIRPFKVGKKNAILLWILCILGITVCLIAIGCGFIPPSEINSHHIVRYEVFLIILMLGSSGIALLLYEMTQLKSKFTHSLCKT